MDLSSAGEAWLRSLGLSPDAVLKMSGREFGGLCRVQLDQSDSADRRAAILETLDWAAAVVDDPTGSWGSEAEKALGLVNPLDWEEDDLDPEIVGDPIPLEEDER